MPDRDSVIQAFRRCFCEDTAACPGCYQEGPGFGYECRKSLCRDVLALLKEQEPVKPVCDIDTWTCGKCGCKLEHQEMIGEILCHDIYEFCPHCGQAVKWGDYGA